MSDNPYLAPQTEDPVLVDGSNHEALRNEHLKHEASIKGMGTLYLLGAAVVLAGAFISGTTTGSLSEIGERELGFIIVLP